ncbi:MAG: BatA domain-containing protein [Flavobacteriales bacterium]|nr:BatA domain-containing protein [Flavobacteriales bacterium]
MMKFLNPSLLYALFALAIPIIIHLFNFQRFKKVYFTQVRFLRNLQQQTRSHSRLKHLLVLTTRLLALAFLILAFAQPFIPEGDHPTDAGKKAISVYIDNSFSMDATNEEGRLLELAKMKAREVADAYAPTDIFQLITNDFLGKQQRLLSKEDFLEALGEVETSPDTRSISEVYKRQQDALSQHQGTRIAYILSDYQKSITDLDVISQDTTITLNLVAMHAEKASNVYIDSVWFENPVRMSDTPEQLTVRIKNASDEEHENIPVKLMINGHQKAMASIRTTPGSTQDVVLTYTTEESGIQYGEIALVDYPIVYDDHYFFAYSIADSLSILCINQNEESEAVNALFGDDAYVRLRNVSAGSIDFSAFSGQHMIVLNELTEIATGLQDELAKFVNEGGSLWVFPNALNEQEPINSLLSQLGTGLYTSLDTQRTKVSSFFKEHLLYEHIFEKVPENMDFPVTGKHYVMTSSQSTSEEVLLRLQDNHPFISRYKSGRGFVYTSAVPSNDKSFYPFGNHSLNVLTLYQAALHSQSANDLFTIIGADDAITLGKLYTGSEGVLTIKKLGSEGSFIPEQRSGGLKTILYTHGQVNEAGLYVLKAGSSDLLGLAFNYERKESETATYTAEDLKTITRKLGISSSSVMDGGISEFALAITRQAEGTRLWRICIWLALLMLATETAFIRLLK